MSTTVLWANETVDGPYTDGIIATSAEISNTNGDDSLDITLQLESYTPDGVSSLVGYEVDMFIEEEVTSGVWIPVASIDKQGLNGTNRPQNQILQYGPQILPNEGDVLDIRAGGKIVTNVSRTNGVLGDKVRVKLVCVVTDATKPPLTSLTFSAQARKYARS